jgi:hypothetical protein
MGHRKHARVLCRVAAIAGLIAFFLPGYTDARTPNSQTMKIRLGLPFSPWLHWQSESRTERGPDVAAGTASFSTSISSKWGVEVFTWSTAALVGGIALFAVANFLRDPSPPPTAAP